VLLPGNRRKTKAINVLPPGTKVKEMLPPGERYKAKVINVPLPGNAGGGSKKNVIIRPKATKGMLLLKRRLQQSIIIEKIL